MAKKPKKPPHVKPENTDDEARNSNWFIQVGNHVINAGKPKGKDIDKWVARTITKFKKAHPNWDKLLEKP